MAFHASDSVGGSDSVSISVGYGPDRPWFEKWREVLDACAALDAAYRGEVRLPDTNNYKRLGTDFCDSCLEVRDWLKEDDRITVSDQAIDAHVKASPWISLCADVSNTDKHLHRPEGRREARVQSVTLPDNFMVKMTVAAPDLAMDMQDLAERAVAEWRAFFSVHNITQGV